MNLFVITGVCQPGETLDYLLPRFLVHPRHDVMLWIDFKDALDFHRHMALRDQQCPTATLESAPRAMWGGASIVASMLSAITSALNRPRWDRLIFCSIRDVPLISCVDIAASLERDWNFDYCGSRWNAYTSDVLLPVERVPVAEWRDDRTYRRYAIRNDMSFLVEAELETIYSPEAVISLRLCDELYQRYLSAAVECPIDNTLALQRMTPYRAKERHAYFSHHGLVTGRQWCVLSRRFCEMLHRWHESLYMFRDIIIPDECFFQTVANQMGDAISIRWENIYYGDADNLLIDMATLGRITRQRTTKVLARKRAPSLTMEALQAVQIFPFDLVAC